jgi:hypothetical protein
LVEKPNIDLQIDRLVLHGFSHREAGAIGKALELELARLFEQEGLPSGLSSGGSIPLLKGSRLKIPTRAKAVRIGKEIANSLYAGLGKKNSGRMPTK